VESFRFQKGVCMRSVVGRIGFSALFALVLVYVALVMPSNAAAQGGEPQYFAIRGARVVPVSGPPIEDATIVIARGVIVAVAKGATIPADAWVIEGKGLTVYPGLVDALTDVGLPPPPPANANEPAQRRPTEVAHGPEDRPNSFPWRNAADEVSLADKRIETWRNAGFTTVICAPKTGFFPGQAAVLDLGGDRSADLVVKSSVAIPVSTKPIGGFGSGFPDSLMGVLGYEHQLFIDTAWYEKSQDAYEKSPRGLARPRYDRASAALAEALEDHAIVLLSANSAPDMRRALDLAERWKVNAAIYGGQSGYEVAEELAAKKIPVLIDLKWPEKEKDSDPEDVPTLRTLRLRDRAPSTPATFAKSGVKFAFYSGATANPKDLLKAVRKSMDAGLAPDAAIRALTLSPAEIYGVSDRLGSIEKGKIANLLITDGDLFNEKTKFKLIFVDGRRYEIREPEKPKDPPKGDITGKWKLSFTSPEGPDEATADLVMASDGTLTGTIVSKHGTASILSGYLSADKFNFVVNISIGPAFADVTFNGTFDGTTLKGVINVQEYSIDFTGVKPGKTSSLAAVSSLSQGDAR
jgi:imidazolonepropionase-like amidohydrolase